MFSFIFIDRFQIGFEIGHKASHHTTRKPRSNKQRVHQTILRTVKSKKIIHKFLNHTTYFHVRLHIYFRHLETGIFQHSLYTEQIGMPGTPGKWFHTHINIIAACLANFKNACHIKTGSCMAMILHRNIRMCSFYIGHNLS